MAAKPTPPLAEKFAEELLYLFGIDLRLDDAERCPKKLCSTCSIIVKRNYRTETKSGVPHLSAVHVIREREACMGDECERCSEWLAERKGGRPKKMQRRGRPSASIGHVQSDEPKGKLPRLAEQGSSDEATATSSRLCLTGTDQPLAEPAPVKLAAEKELAPDRFTSDLKGDFFICPICLNVVDEAMAVPPPHGCEHTCCRGCWEEWLAVKATCPVCWQVVQTKDLQPASRLLRGMLGNLMLHCDCTNRGCQDVVRLEDLQRHVSVCLVSSQRLLSHVSSCNCLM